MPDAVAAPPSSAGCRARSGRRTDWSAPRRSRRAAAAPARPGRTSCQICSTCVKMRRISIIGYASIRFIKQILNQPAAPARAGLPARMAARIGARRLILANQRRRPDQAGGAQAPARASGPPRKACCTSAGSQRRHIHGDQHARPGRCRPSARTPAGARMRGSSTVDRIGNHRGGRIGLGRACAPAPSRCRRCPAKSCGRASRWWRRRAPAAAGAPRTGRRSQTPRRALRQRPGRDRSANRPMRTRLRRRPGAGRCRRRC